PAFRAARRLILSGRVGAVERIDVLWHRSPPWTDADPPSWKDSPGTGGGVLANYGIHVFDYVGWLAGRPTVAHATTEHPPGSPDRPDDHVVLELLLAGGATAHAELSLRLKPGTAATHRVEVSGTAGRLVLATGESDDH